MDSELPEPPGAGDGAGDGAGEGVGEGDVGVSEEDEPPPHCATAIVSTPTARI